MQKSQINYAKLQIDLYKKKRIKKNDQIDINKDDKIKTLLDNPLTNFFKPIENYNPKNIFDKFNLQLEEKKKKENIEKKITHQEKIKSRPKRKIKEKSESVFLETDFEENKIDSILEIDKKKVFINNIDKRNNEFYDIEGIEQTIVNLENSSTMKIRNWIKNFKNIYRKKNKENYISKKSTTHKKDIKFYPKSLFIYGNTGIGKWTFVNNVVKDFGYSPIIIDVFIRDKFPKKKKNDIEQDQIDKFLEIIFTNNNKKICILIKDIENIDFGKKTIEKLKNWIIDPKYFNVLVIFVSQKIETTNSKFSNISDVIIFEKFKKEELKKLKVFEIFHRENEEEIIEKSRGDIRKINTWMIWGLELVQFDIFSNLKDTFQYLIEPNHSFEKKVTRLEHNSHFIDCMLFENMYQVYCDDQNIKDCSEIASHFSDFALLQDQGFGIIEQETFDSNLVSMFNYWNKKKRNPNKKIIDKIEYSKMNTFKSKQSNNNFLISKLTLDLPWLRNFISYQEFPNIFCCIFDLWLVLLKKKKKDTEFTDYLEKMWNCGFRYQHFIKVDQFLQYFHNENKKKKIFYHKKNFITVEEKKTILYQWFQIQEINFYQS